MGGQLLNKGAIIKWGNQVNEGDQLTLMTSMTYMTILIFITHGNWECHPPHKRVMTKGHIQIFEILESHSFQKCSIYLFF